MAVMRSVSIANDAMASLLYSTYVRWFHRKSNLSIIFYNGVCSVVRLVLVKHLFTTKESNRRMINAHSSSLLSYFYFISNNIENT